MRIAVLQMRAGIEPAANAKRLTAAVAEAAAGGAVMLFTPEMSGLLDRDRARAAGRIVEEREDVVLAAVREAAAAHGIWVALGSLAVATNERWANRSFVVDANGAVVGRYDKLHLFDVTLASGEQWRESAAYSAGEQAVAVDSPCGRLGLSVCYDLRFPALYQALAEAGCDLLAVPSAFTVPTGRAHWHTLLRARAIENAAFVVAAAQSGCHEDGRATYGHSLVIDPWGEVLLDGGEGEGVLFCDIELARVRQALQQVPVRASRRAIPPVMVLP